MTVVEYSLKKINLAGPDLLSFLDSLKNFALWYGSPNLVELDEWRFHRPTISS